MRDYSALERAARRRDPDFRHLPPIDDILLVLHLLVDEGDRTRVRLMCNPLMLTEPYIEVMNFGGGYTRDLHDGSDYYPVAKTVVSELKRNHYVEGRKFWGGTDEHECTISEYGRSAYWNAAKGFEANVKEFLAHEHPEVVFAQTTTSPRLHSIRYRHNFSDFFIGMEINDARDEVRRTRGIFSLARRETQNAE